MKQVEQGDNLPSSFRCFKGAPAAYTHWSMCGLAYNDAVHAAVGARLAAAATPAQCKAVLTLFNAPIPTCAGA